MRVRQHIPSFVSGFEREEGEVHTGEELELLSFVNRWMHMPDFYRFSVGKYLEGSYLLMAEFEQGAHFWVVARLSGEDAPVIVRDYPVWEAKAKEA